MNEKIEEIPNYLIAKGITVSETSIVNAAIQIATRWGGNAVFIGEFERRVNR